MKSSPVSIVAVVSTAVFLTGIPIRISVSQERVVSPEDGPIVVLDVSADGSPTRLLNRDKCREVTVEGVKCLEIERDTDPYSKVQWEFQFSEDPSWWSKPVVLEVQFFDKGAGIVEPLFLHDDAFNGSWIPPSRHASYTRLNTKRVRSAYFGADLSGCKWEDAEKPHLLVTGLQYLAGMRVHTSFSEADWEAAKSSVPKEVEPMVRLERPMQLVTSAGINNGGTFETLKGNIGEMPELVALAKVLGFTSIESYVRWDWLEPEKEGEFDFRLVDALVEKIREYDMKWFPLLIVGSAYALPRWFFESAENVGFVCLEHGLSDPIQSIWSPYHARHVTRVLQAFGRHYEPMNVLEGIRLGPSGNFGESQYPAGGNWPQAGQGPMHIHIGYWAGDEYAKVDFRDFVREKYQTVENLNHAWETQYEDFSEVVPILPQTIASKRRRLDLTQWYTDSMTDWCDWWVVEAGKALPNTKIYQSSGGWGFRESGTDYSAQAKSMIQVGGGIRLTNETDSYDQNFFATRLAATSARLYGIDLGFEPAGPHTARGIVGRIFNTASSNGDHLFTYHFNIMYHQMAIDRWLEYLPVLDTRQDPVVDVAVYYPETMNQLDDGTFRQLYAWGFNPRAREVRRHVEVDYLDERLIREGFLDRYKVLVHVWGDVAEADVLEKIDGWVRNGGTLIYPSFPRGYLETVDGDSTTFARWTRGDTGQGSFQRYQGDMEPPSLYGDYVEGVLSGMDSLHPWTKAALNASHSDRVFFSVQEDGRLLVLNYSGEEGFLQLEGQPRVALRPYSIERIALAGEGLTGR